MDPFSFLILAGLVKFLSKSTKKAWPAIPSAKKNKQTNPLAKKIGHINLKLPLPIFSGIVEKDECQKKAEQAINGNPFQRIQYLEKLKKNAKRIYSEGPARSIRINEKFYKTFDYEIWHHQNGAIFHCKNDAKNANSFFIEDLEVLRIQRKKLFIANALRKWGTCPINIGEKNWRFEQVLKDINHDFLHDEKLPASWEDVRKTQQKIKGLNPEYREKAGFLFNDFVNQNDLIIEFGQYEKKAYLKTYENVTNYQRATRFWKGPKNYNYQTLPFQLLENDDPVFFRYVYSLKSFSASPDDIGSFRAFNNFFPSVFYNENFKKHLESTINNSINAQVQNLLLPKAGASFPFYFDSTLKGFKKLYFQRNKRAHIESLKNEIANKQGGGFQVIFKALNVAFNLANGFAAGLDLLSSAGNIATKSDFLAKTISGISLPDGKLSYPTITPSNLSTSSNFASFSRVPFGENINFDNKISLDRPSFKNEKGHILCRS